jgi:hypothetical protein
MEGRQDEYQARMASLVGNLTGDTGLWLDAGKERKGKERKQGGTEYPIQYTHDGPL